MLVPHRAVQGCHRARRWGDYTVQRQCSPPSEEDNVCCYINVHCWKCTGICQLSVKSMNVTLKLSFKRQPQAISWKGYLKKKKKIQILDFHFLKVEPQHPLVKLVTLEMKSNAPATVKLLMQQLLIPFPGKGIRPKLHHLSRVSVIWTTMLLEDGCPALAPPCQLLSRIGEERVWCMYTHTPARTTCSFHMTAYLQYMHIVSCTHYTLI